MDKSETIKELAAALSAAQAEIKPAAMNATNPFLKNRYADLGAVIEASRPVLANHGLAVSQLTTGDANTIGVTTVLMHKSGEWLSSTVSLALGDEKGKSQAQVAGSIISYLRRYSLASILGIYADEDTDGHTGTPKQFTPAPARAQKPTNGNAAMTYAEACEVVNSKGEKYGDLDNATLAIMANAIRKAKTPKPEHGVKLQAIDIILAERNNAPPEPEPMESNGDQFEF
jgi:hypothetical protein